MTRETYAQDQDFLKKDEAPSLEGRIAIESIAPEIDGGAWAPKRIEDQEITISADVFCDGHDVIQCDLLWRRSKDEWRRAPMRPIGNDVWTASIPPQKQGRLEFSIEAWRSPFATLIEDVRKKFEAGQNVELELLEVNQFLRVAENSHGEQISTLLQKIERLSNERGQQIALLSSPDVAKMMRAYAEREDVERSKILPLEVNRKRAAFSAWYEIFPRSAANDAARHGTFRDVANRLDYIASMAFDVLYFPPIHPIGSKHKKGRNNSLTAQPDDPGSVYAIGSDAGGHDAIHPELGTIDDFRELVAKAAAKGMEIALDFAIQCSPDHPWINQHPDWFAWRPDGSVRFAENPPKKYEDIVNVKFDGAAFPEAWRHWRDIILYWVQNGVRIFRVDNPHTKPLPFWKWLIAEVNVDHPDVIFLAEAFTRPKMMKRLAKIGFQQSYTYFTWRHSKREIIEYMTELTGQMSDYYRPNFFVNTPDINPFFLQTSGRAGFVVRATLAATLSPSWGLYSGFELCESDALPGREEYLDSEKYQIVSRDFDHPNSISGHIRRLNEIRLKHQALQKLTNMLFLNAWNDNIIAYARIADDRSEIIFVMVNLDPHQLHECVYECPLWEFGLSDFASIEAEDLLFGGRFRLHGKTHQISLDPLHNPVIVWRLVNPDFSSGTST